MLTNTNKKIKSGAISRAEAYATIKAKGLQGVCVNKYGKNFTQCSTADLISLIEANTEKTETPKEETPDKGEIPAPETTTPTTSKCEDVEARAAISKLVEILESNGTIEDCEKEEVLDILGGKVEAASTTEDYKPKSASPYSDDEIDDMFAGMKIK